MSRMKQLKADGISPSLPPVGIGAYLINYLFDVGPVQSNGMGATAITWHDLNAWQQGTGIDLQPWESRGLRRLSSTYLSAANDAEDPSAPPPYSDEPTPDYREMVSKKLRTALSGWSARQPKGH